MTAERVDRPWPCGLALVGLPNRPTPGGCLVATFCNIRNPLYPVCPVAHANIRTFVTLVMCGQGSRTKANGPSGAWSGEERWRRRREQQLRRIADPDQRWAHLISHSFFYSPCASSRAEQPWPRARMSCRLLCSRTQTTPHALPKPYTPSF